MILPLFAILAASLLGSLHCAGMCGAFVAFAVGDPAAPRRGMVHGAYHGGRLATYALLGLAAGGLGAALDLGGAWVGLPRAAALLAGAVMVAFGAVTLLRLFGFRLGALRLPGFLQSLALAGQCRVMGYGPLTRAAAVGLLTTLLPCGWLWTFVATAAGAGSAVRGLLVMAVFWAGTLPVMVTLGVGVRHLTARLGAKLPVVTASLILAVGLYTLATRMGKEAAVAAMPRTATVQQATQAAEEAPPCCRNKAQEASVQP